MKQAKASTSIMPPAGFTVAAAPPPPSPAEQAADLVKSKTPKQMSFAEWELVLSSGNQQAADTVWNAIKDKAVKLRASVISATATSVQLAGSDDDIDAKKADITLTMAKADSRAPDARRWAHDGLPGNGGQLHAQSVHDDMTDGVLLDKNGKPLDGRSGAQPRRRTEASNKPTEKRSITGSSQRCSRFFVAEYPC